MEDRPLLTDKTIDEVFNNLYLNQGSAPLGNLMNFGEIRNIEEGVIFTRLSDNSVPPPTGRMMDANLERASK